MGAIADFIKNFPPPQLDFGIWGWLAFIGAILGLLALTRWIASFSPGKKGDLLVKSANRVVQILFYAIIILLALKSVLTEEYTVLIVIFILFLSNNIDSIFKAYDRFADKRIDKG